MMKTNVNFEKHSDFNNLFQETEFSCFDIEWS